MLAGFSTDIKRIGVLFLPTLASGEDSVGVRERKGRTGGLSRPAPLYPTLVSVSAWMAEGWRGRAPVSADGWLGHSLSQLVSPFSVFLSCPQHKAPPAGLLLACQRGVTPHHLLSGDGGLQGDALRGRSHFPRCDFKGHLRIFNDGHRTVLLRWLTDKIGASVMGYLCKPPGSISLHPIGSFFVLIFPVEGPINSDFPMHTGPAVTGRFTERTQPGPVNGKLIMPARRPPPKGRALSPLPSDCDFTPFM